MVKISDKNERGPTHALCIATCVNKPHAYVSACAFLGAGVEGDPRKALVV